MLIFGLFTIDGDQTVHYGTSHHYFLCGHARHVKIVSINF